MLFFHHKSARHGDQRPLAWLLALVALAGCANFGMVTSVVFAAVPISKNQGVASVMVRADQLAAVLLAQFPEYADCPRPDDPGALRYIASSTDLNGDGKLEAVALVLGREACGSGGCTAFVLTDTGSKYRLMARITTVSAPIGVSIRRSTGWRDLIVKVAGGGAEAGSRVLRYDGKNYPDNASLAPMAEKETKATPLISDAKESLALATPLTPVACAGASSVTATESLGGLRIGASAGVVEPIFGHPKTLSKPQLWEADGLYHRNWTFPSTGAVVGLSSPNLRGPWTVFSLTLKGTPGKFATARGIKLGASRKDVLAAYGKGTRADGLYQHEPQTILIGSDYDALLFRFDYLDRVIEINLGAAAD